jgi:hypothetical protein
MRAASISDIAPASSVITWPVDCAPPPAAGDESHSLQFFLLSAPAAFANWSWMINHVARGINNRHSIFNSSRGMAKFENGGM